MSLTNMSTKYACIYDLVRLIQFCNSDLNQFVNFNAVLYKLMYKNMEKLSCRKSRDDHKVYELNHLKLFD